MDVFYVVTFTLLTAVMLAGLVWKAYLFFKRVRALKEEGILKSGGDAKEAKKQ